MRLKYLIAALAAAVALAACSEPELGGPTDLPDDVTIPQGLASPQTDAKIVSLYEQYGSYFLYDYTEKEVLWRLVNASSTYRYNILPPELDHIGDQLDLFGELFLGFYPDAFLKKHMPYKVFLAKEVVQDEGWRQTEFFALFFGNSILLGYADERAAGADPAMKYREFNLAHEGFTQWLFGNGRFAIPDGFAAMSDYTLVLGYPADYYEYPTECSYEWIEAPDDEHLEAGFLGANGEYWSDNQKITTDFQNYLNYMRYFAPDSPQWERYLSFPKVRAKYDFIRGHWLKTHGYDPAQLGNADFGTITL